MSIRTSEGPRVAVLTDAGTVVDEPSLASYPNIIDALRDWSELETSLATLDPSALKPLAGEIEAPLQFPAKILCSGPNFRDHLAEMGENDLGPEWQPYFFMKPPTTAVIGPNAPIPVPSDPGAKGDWEGELAAVIGTGGRWISPSDALAHVAGWAVCNDISFRGPHRREVAPTPFVWDWVASKGADGSLPIGPGIVPSFNLPDPQDLAIKTWVNDEMMQNGTTADMVYDMAGLISAASGIVTLEPGDLILSGTPAGVGAGRGIFLKPGDSVTVEIGGLGRLTNPIVALDPPANFPTGSPQ